MASTRAARPAKQPVRAVALCDDDEADARKRAGVVQRKKTVASTMVYAGLGPRASQGASSPAPKKPAVKKPAAKKTAAAPRKRPRTHAQMIARLTQAISGQLDRIEAITRNPRRGEAGPNEAERHARTVAQLARVAAELRKEMDDHRRRRSDDDRSACEPDTPRDLDELRERLSRRLDIRLGGGSAVSVGDDAAGGNHLPE